jgi:hypothetical protein
VCAVRPTVGTSHRGPVADRLGGATPRRLHRRVLRRATRLRRALVADGYPTLYLDSTLG